MKTSTVRLRLTTSTYELPHAITHPLVQYIFYKMVLPFCTILQTPVVSRIPASMLMVTSGDSYLKALKNLNNQQRARARIVAAGVLADSIKRGQLGGFQERLKDLTPEMQRLAIRHVVNGWRQYHTDPRAENMRKARNIKDPKLRLKAQQWIEESMRYGD